MITKIFFFDTCFCIGFTFVVIFRVQKRRELPELWKKGLQKRRHRGKYENTWNQVDNNFGWKKFWTFFEILRSEISKLCHFICQKNRFVSWYAWWKRCFGVWKSQRTTRKHVKTIWQQFWAKKIFELFLRFWRSEISKLRHFHDVIRPKNEFPPTSR